MKLNRLPGKSAVVYARYSSHNQRDVSIEQQVNACRKFAADNDLEIIRVYDDHAMTGTNDNRPDFQRMIQDSASGAFDYVLVYSLDRFSRDKYDSVIHKHTLKENGVRVLSATENIQDNPSGALMETILEGFADYYSKELAQKIKRGMMSNAEKCLVTGPLPYGYRRGDDGRYAIIPEEAAVVREIFIRVANRELLADITRSLNERGLVTHRGVPWNRASFSKLLHNEEYIGVYKRLGLRIEGGVPAILDRTLFDRVQEQCRMKKNPRNNPLRRRQAAGTYLLTGKLFCGHCKSPMIGVSGTGEHGELHFYYTCKKRRADKHACDKRQVTRDFAERQIASEINRVISQPDMIRWIADCTMEYLASEQQTEELSMLRDRLATVRKKKKNLYDAIENGMIDDEIKSRFEQLNAEESSLNAKISIAKPSSKPITREHIIAWVESFVAGDIEDKDYQETLFDAFLLRAYLYDDRIKLILNCTRNPEIEIPFDIDSIETPASEVRISSSEGHHSHLIRTFNDIHFIAGLFVLVSKIVARK